MKIYQSSEEDIVKAIIQSVEQETDQKIFTLRLLEHEDDIDDEEEYLNVLIVFDDKSVLMANVFIEEINENLAVRVKGNYL